MDEQLRPLPREIERDQKRKRRIAREIGNAIPRAPGSRENPDYQNTNILRSAFRNAGTQGWE